ncbi:MAG: polyphosphate kinase 1 [Pseudomonadales bacterium]|nr:polyphosphate kinase 1 [Pseudomonadales bacterium]
MPEPFSINKQARDTLPEQTECRAGRFLNRELSDLNFISRVLEESNNLVHPILERLRFLSISAEVLDQFYTVRVAKMRHKIASQVSTPTVDGLMPIEELDRVDCSANELMTLQDASWLNIRHELERNGIDLVGHYRLTDAETEFLDAHFLQHVYPVLSLFTIDLEHPFPFIASGGICIVIEIQRKNTVDASKILIQLPSSVPRFIRLPGNKVRFASLETMIYLSWDFLFPGHAILGSGLFQILRDNQLALDERTDDLMGMIESGLKRRSRANGIRLKVNSGMPENLRIFIAQQLKMLSDDEMLAYSEANNSIVESKYIAVSGLLGLADTTQIIADIICDRFPALSFSPYLPRVPNRLTDFSNNCFNAIKEKDLLVHWPFESFNVLLHFLDQAAADDNVLSIKQTLYRTSDDSPIVEALERAAEAGKSVTVVVELSARDNERSNIHLSRRLEALGAQVIYGIAGLKVHCKATSVVRREGTSTTIYSHFSTGNYHPGNARLYTDLSFFTCAPVIGRDNIALFNYLSSGVNPHGVKKLVIAPSGLRQQVISLIEKEISLAKSGEPASMWIKLNSITDPAVIDLLYEASTAGVKIELIVRRQCRLRPGVPGLSDNIRVKSIVGRFLEHSRIYCFGAGVAMPSPKAKVFIGSADWMERNFDDRVEIMLPIEDPTVHKQILEQVMVANIKDTRQSWLLLPDGDYKKITSSQPFSSQEYFMDTLSHSGLGSRRNKVVISALELPSK